MHRRHCCRSLIIVTLLASAASAGTTTRVSVSSAGTQADNWSGGHMSISADGRYVAFSSEAANLVPGDTNACSDVFVWDRMLRETSRVSVSSTGKQGDGRSEGAAISADGRFVAFVSYADNLVADDTNGYAGADIFLHDRMTGQTSRESVSSAGLEGAGGSWAVRISANGRYVTFGSDAANMVPGDTNGTHDLFVRDRVVRKTVRISVSSRGAQANGPSYLGGISADGRYVVFESEADNLVPNDTNHSRDVFLRDCVLGQTTQLSISTAGTQGNCDSNSASISGDGRFVAFSSGCTNLIADDTNGTGDVFVRDRATGSTSRVSVSSTGVEANGMSGSPRVSADGRWVVFGSDASNLVAGDGNGCFDVFAHDRATRQTSRISMSTSGIQANSDNWASSWSSTSADGRYVAFSSEATNLVPADTNRTSDVFLRDTSVTAPTPPAGGSLVRANFHTHTRASDGDHTVGPTADQLIATALSLGLRGLGISDHAEAVTGSEWSEALTATSPPPIGPAALRGFEWTEEAPGVHNHISIFGTIGKARANDGHEGRTHGTLVTTVGGLYNWVRSAPPLYGGLPLGQFNHLGYSGDESNAEVHFCHYSRPNNPTVNRIMALAELAVSASNDLTPSGSRTLPSLDVIEGERQWRDALRMGWRLAPALGADNSLNIAGTAAKHHTGVYLLPQERLSQYSLMSALLSRRTFASQDRRAAAQLRCGQYFMGSQDVAVRSPVTVTAAYARTTAGGSCDIQDEGCRFVVDDTEYAPTSGPVLEPNGIWWRWTLRCSLKSGAHWVYARFIQDDHDQDRIFTAPIWLTVGSEPAALAISSLVAAATERGHAQATFALSAPASVTIRITNIGGRVVRHLGTSRGRQGLNTVLWDGRSSSGQAVPDGRYLWQIAAGDGGTRCQALTSCTLRRR